jgi:putative ABC transport system ATP-binding protein
MRSPASSAAVVIRTVTLVRTYTLGGTVMPALRGVSIGVARGEFVAITGASGSGKSTLMNLLGCLDTPTAGVYELNGQLVGQLSHDQLARLRRDQIGFVFQSFNLLPRMSALENVALPLLYGGGTRREHRSRAREMLAVVGLAERAQHRPSELSGGQQQRVAIARALVNEPALLLADEPTGSLDSTASWEILRLFRALNRRGVTIVLVTHNPVVAGEAGRELRLSDGLIVEDRQHAGSAEGS